MILAFGAGGWMDEARPAFLDFGLGGKKAIVFASLAWSCMVLP